MVGLHAAVMLVRLAFEVVGLAVDLARRFPNLAVVLGVALLLQLVVF